MNSLLYLSTESVFKNMAKFNTDELELLSILPANIKNDLLHKFTKAKFLWKNIDFPQMLRRLIHKDARKLDLTACAVNDEILEILQPCKKLDAVSIKNVDEKSLSKNGLLKFIPQLKYVKLLTLSKCESVDDDVLQCVADNCKLLTGLDIGGCTKITDESIIGIARLENLLYLTCSQTQISDKGIDHLVHGPSGVHLTEIRLSKCPNLTENMFSLIGLNCPNLKIFDVYNCKNVNCFSLLEGKLQKLRQINWTIEW